MEEILVKLANIFEMNVDRVLETYPILRDQYTNVYIISNIADVVQGLGLVIGAVAIGFAVFGFFSLADGEGTDILKISMVLGFIFLILEFTNIILNGIVVNLAPDLMFLKTLI